MTIIIRRCSLIVVMVAVATITTMGRSPQAGAMSCTDAPAGHVAVVIDFGSAPGAPGGIESDCVATSARMTGIGAISQATGGRIGFDSSSKVCQIDGVPANFDQTNCSTPVNGMISYWAYFHGVQEGWVYSSIGAGGWRVDPTVVEGWRFVTVPVGATSTAEPPADIAGVGKSYRWQSTCPSSAVSTATTAAALPDATGVPTSQGATVSPGSPPTSVGDAAGEGSSSPATTSIGSSGTSRPSVTAGGARRSNQVAPRISHARVVEETEKSGGTSTWLLWAVVAVLLAVMSGVTFRVRRRN